MILHQHIILLLKFSNLIAKLLNVLLLGGDLSGKARVHLLRTLFHVGLGHVTAPIFLVLDLLELLLVLGCSFHNLV